jgi:hypothetical protein
MALAILDGNQAATNLSTIITSGQHITAHTVVSLGTQAITDMRSAVSGSVVSISNFPTSQSTTFGAVTGSISVLNFPASQAVTFLAVSISNLPATQSTTFGAITGSVSVLNFPSSQAVTFADSSLTNTQLRASAVTIGGTVTANTGLTQPLTNTELRASSINVLISQPSSLSRVGVNLVDASGTGNYGTSGSALNVAGTVTANLNLPSFAGADGDVVTRAVNIGYYDANFGEFKAVNSSNTPLPISGTVTASLAISSTAITSGSFSSLTSATLVPRNTARKMATIYNLGAGQLFVNAGASCTTLGGGFMVKLSSGDFYECNYTTTTLSAIFATAGTASWVSH